MIRILISFSLSIFLCAATLRGTDFYVDGKRGTDAPTAGTQARPWQTIAYALRQIPSPPATSRHRLLVVGNQDYRVDASITLRDRIHIVGTGSQPPRLLAGLTPTLFRIDAVGAGTDFGLVGLVLLWGDVAVAAGPATDAVPKTCQIIDCEFFGQKVASVRALFVAGLFRFDVVRSRFSNVNKGVEIYARGPSLLTGNVRQCVFASTGLEAISFRAESVAKLVADVRMSRFRFCNRAIAVRADSIQPSDVGVRNCAFRNTHVAGVDVSVAGSCALAVRESSFILDDNAIVVRSTDARGACRLDLDNNVIDSSRNAGLDVRVDASSPTAGPWSVRTRDNRWQGCAQNYRFAALGQVTASLVSERELSQRSTGDAMDIALTSPNARCEMSNAILTRSRRHGIFVSGKGRMRGRFLTIADHGGGSAIHARQAVDVELDHCALDNRFAPEIDSGANFRLSWTCSRTVQYSGVGNFRADPAFVRPQYKLGATSACIDTGNPSVANAPTTDYEGDPRVVRTLRPVVDIGADEYRATGSTRAFAVPGWGIDNGMIPRVDILSDRAPIGTPVPLGLRDAIGSGGRAAPVAFVVFGLGEAEPIYDFDVFGGSGSMLFFNPLVLGQAVRIDRQGRARDILPVPNNATLVGAVFTAQWLVLDPNANRQAWVTTDAFRLQVGR